MGCMIFRGEQEALQLAGFPECWKCGPKHVRSQGCDPETATASMLKISSFGIGVGDFNVVLLGGSATLHVRLLLAGSVRIDLGWYSLDLSEGAAGTHACSASHATSR